MHVRICLRAYAACPDFLSGRFLQSTHAAMSDFLRAQIPLDLCTLPVQFFKMQTPAKNHMKHALLMTLVYLQPAWERPAARHSQRIPI